MRPDRSDMSHAVTPSKRQPKPRWKRRKDARPGEIVAAALEVFGERGFAATKLADVARHAGVTKGTVYLYFDSKEALFKAVVRETIVPVIAQGEALARALPVNACARASPWAMTGTMVSRTTALNRERPRAGRAAGAGILAAGRGDGGRR